MLWDEKFPGDTNVYVWKVTDTGPSTPVSGVGTIYSAPHGSYTGTLKASDGTTANVQITF